MEVDLGNNINDDDNTSLKSFKSHEDDFDDQNALFSIGNVVVVFPRTWPGINKLGGVGRILKVYRNEDGEPVYDIKYTVEGGREFGVEERYIRPNETKTDNIRQNIKGRCMIPCCPCFIKDCGHIQPNEILKEDEAPTKDEKHSDPKEAFPQKRKPKRNFSESVQRKHSSSSKRINNLQISTTISSSSSSEYFSDDDDDDSSTESSIECSNEPTLKAKNTTQVRFPNSANEKSLHNDKDLADKLNKLLDDIESFAHRKSKTRLEDADNNFLQQEGDGNELTSDQTDCQGIQFIYHHITLEEAFQLMLQAKKRFNQIYYPKLLNILKAIEFYSDKVHQNDNFDEETNEELISKIISLEKKFDSIDFIITWCVNDVCELSNKRIHSLNKRSNHKNSLSIEKADLILNDIKINHLSNYYQRKREIETIFDNLHEYFSNDKDNFDGDDDDQDDDDDDDLHQKRQKISIQTKSQPAYDSTTYGCGSKRRATVLLVDKYYDKANNQQTKHSESRIRKRQMKQTTKKKSVTKQKHITGRTVSHHRKRSSDNVNNGEDNRQYEEDEEENDDVVSDDHNSIIIGDDDDNNERSDENVMRRHRKHKKTMKIFSKHQNSVSEDGPNDFPSSTYRSYQHQTSQYLDRKLKRLQLKKCFHYNQNDHDNHNDKHVYETVSHSDDYMTILLNQLFHQKMIIFHNFPWINKMNLNENYHETSYYYNLILNENILVAYDERMKMTLQTLFHVVITNSYDINEEIRQYFFECYNHTIIRHNNDDIIQRLSQYHKQYMKQFQLLFYLDFSTELNATDISLMIYQLLQYEQNSLFSIQNISFVTNLLKDCQNQDVTRLTLSSYLIILLQYIENLSNQNLSNQQRKQILLFLMFFILTIFDYFLFKMNYFDQFMMILSKLRLQNKQNVHNNDQRVKYLNYDIIECMIRLQVMLLWNDIIVILGYDSELLLRIFSVIIHHNDILTNQMNRSDNRGDSNDGHGQDLNNNTTTSSQGYSDRSYQNIFSFILQTNSIKLDDMKSILATSVVTLYMNLIFLTMRLGNTTKVVNKNLLINFPCTNFESSPFDHINISLSYLIQLKNSNHLLELNAMYDHQLKLYDQLSNKIRPFFDRKADIVDESLFQFHYDSISNAIPISVMLSYDNQILKFKAGRNDTTSTHEGISMMVMNILTLHTYAIHHVKNYFDKTVSISTTISPNVMIDTSLLKKSSNWDYIDKMISITIKYFSNFLLQKLSLKNILQIQNQMIQIIFFYLKNLSNFVLIWDFGDIGCKIFISTVATFMTLFLKFDKLKNDNIEKNDITKQDDSNTPIIIEIKPKDTKTRKIDKKDNKWLDFEFFCLVLSNLTSTSRHHNSNFGQFSRSFVKANDDFDPIDYHNVFQFMFYYYCRDHEIIPVPISNNISPFYPRNETLIPIVVSSNTCSYQYTHDITMNILLLFRSLLCHIHDRDPNYFHPHERKFKNLMKYFYYDDKKVVTDGLGNSYGSSYGHGHLMNIYDSYPHWITGLCTITMMGEVSRYCMTSSVYQIRMGHEMFSSLSSDQNRILLFLLRITILTISKDVTGDRNSDRHPSIQSYQYLQSYAHDILSYLQHETHCLRSNNHPTSYPTVNTHIPISIPTININMHTGNANDASYNEQKLKLTHLLLLGVSSTVMQHQLHRMCQNLPLSHIIPLNPSYPLSSLFLTASIHSLANNKLNLDFQEICQNCSTTLQMSYESMANQFHLIQLFIAKTNERLFERKKMLIISFNFFRNIIARLKHWSFDLSLYHMIRKDDHQMIQPPCNTLLSLLSYCYDSNRLHEMQLLHFILPKQYTIAMTPKYLPHDRQAKETEDQSHFTSRLPPISENFRLIMKCLLSSSREVKPNFSFSNHHDNQYDEMIGRFTSLFPQIYSNNTNLDDSYLSVIETVSTLGGLLQALIYITIRNSDTQATLQPSFSSLNHHDNTAQSFRTVQPNTLPNNPTHHPTFYPPFHSNDHSTLQFPSLPHPLENISDMLLNLFHGFNYKSKPNKLNTHKTMNNTLELNSISSEAPMESWLLIIFWNHVFDQSYDELLQMNKNPCHYYDYRSEYHHMTTENGHKTYDDTATSYPVTNSSMKIIHVAHQQLSSSAMNMKIELLRKHYCDLHTIWITNLTNFIIFPHLAIELQFDKFHQLLYYLSRYFVKEYETNHSELSSADLSNPRYQNRYNNYHLSKMFLFSNTKIENDFHFEKNNITNHKFVLQIKNWCLQKLHSYYNFISSVSHLIQKDSFYFSVPNNISDSIIKKLSFYEIFYRHLRYVNLLLFQENHQFNQSNQKFIIINTNFDYLLNRYQILSFHIQLLCNPFHTFTTKFLMNYIHYILNYDIKCETDKMKQYLLQSLQILFPHMNRNTDTSTNMSNRQSHMVPGTHHHQGHLLSTNFSSNISTVLNILNQTNTLQDISIFSSYIMTYIHIIPLISFVSNSSSYAHILDILIYNSYIKHSYDYFHPNSSSYSLMNHMSFPMNTTATIEDKTSTTTNIAENQNNRADINWRFIMSFCFGLSVPMFVPSQYKAQLIQYLNLPKYEFDIIKIIPNWQKNLECIDLFHDVVNYEDAIRHYIMTISEKTSATTTTDPSSTSAHMTERPFIDINYLQTTTTSDDRFHQNVTNFYKQTKEFRQNFVCNDDLWANISKQPILTNHMMMTRCTTTIYTSYLLTIIQQFLHMKLIETTELLKPYENLSKIQVDLTNDHQYMKLQIDKFLLSQSYDYCTITTNEEQFLLLSILILTLQILRILFGEPIVQIYQQCQYQYQQYQFDKEYVLICQNLQLIYSILLTSILYHIEIRNDNHPPNVPLQHQNHSYENEKKLLIREFIETTCILLNCGKYYKDMSKESISSEQFLQLKEIIKLKCNELVHKYSFQCLSKRISVTVTSHCHCTICKSPSIIHELQFQLENLLKNLSKSDQMLKHSYQIRLQQILKYSPSLFASSRLTQQLLRQQQRAMSRITAQKMNG